jgi:signal transduction histidine kinase
MRPSRDDPSQRHLARILEATRVSAELVHELEAYTGAANSARAKVDISEILSEVCGELEFDLPPSFRLHFRRPGTSLTVLAAPTQLRICLYNLLINAVEATQGGSREIEVVAAVDHIDPAQISDLVCGAEQPPGDYVYVEIRDEAGGMDLEIQERALEPLFSTKEKNRGSGLSTVLGIARSHGAALGLSNDPGWGCTFTLYFPLHHD